VRVILFGAGASNGSGAVHPEPPPLGGDLFRLLAQAFPQTWRALPPPYRAAFAGPFEKGMAAILATHLVSPLMQDMALFFTQYLVAPGNAYTSFVAALREAGRLDDAAFATLNYECLLEMALSATGRSVNYWDAFQQSTDESAVWKLHGSCNFLPSDHGNAVVRARRGVSFVGTGGMFNVALRATDLAEARAFVLGDTALFPAMAFYAPGKQVQISQATIQHIQGHYAAAVSAATAVAVIGVRPNPEDDHVWGPLASTPARVLFVGGRDEYTDWKRSHRGRRPTRYLGGRFNEAIDGLVAAL